MAAKFSLTTQAASDVDEIWEYIAESNLDAADNVLASLYKAMGKLAQMPGIGSLKPMLADDRHRFWVVAPYVIVYRPETSPLQIIRVLHGSRDIANLL